MIFTCNHKAPCGCSNRARLQSKIVGGQNAKIKTWTWVVSLHYRNKFLCAGSIISDSWILTAAHCFSVVKNLDANILKTNASDIMIHFGSINQQEEYHLSKVIDIILHPKFDESTFINDIALVKLSSSLHLDDDNLAKICLPIVSWNMYPPVASSASLVAVGWGRLWENGPESSILQQVILTAIDYHNIACYPLIYDQSKQFCAGVENSKRDTCQGDSGGPIMIFTLSKQWVIVGVTSFGYGCAKVGYSGVYTRVTAYLDWIRLIINSTHDSMHPSTLTSNSPYDDDDMDWQSNISVRHPIVSSLFIIMSILFYLILKDSS